MQAGTITYKPNSNNGIKTIGCIGLLLIIPFKIFAQQKIVSAASGSIFSNNLFIALLIIVIVLLLVIAALGEAVKAAAHQKTEQNENRKCSIPTNLKTLLILVMFGTTVNSLLAQTTVPTVITKHADSYWGLDGFTFYLMVSIILFELFVAWLLYDISIQLLGVKEHKRMLAEEKVKLHLKKPSFIEKINASVAIEKEADIMLDHNYDGIRELDNNLPPWWKYGFYITIIWSAVYLFHFHVLRSGRLQLAEYEEQLVQAKKDMEEYRKKAANLVDENNATALKNEESISSGRSIYVDNCAACHGKLGEGGVGPNLTDDYWMHKGGIRDIFKTIKYGWPEKGMKAWQQDLGAKQINEVASYILTLHGTNPANQKEKQGELYQGEQHTDSTKLAGRDSILSKN